ncbi:Outer membrane protein assembly factor BamB, contains PQQ-like beta-propeller repeat [Micromonospora pallida]|uniref:Outer membrane protein assembly factor BamB, contains PQQ-like beta-propeller repeat n=1 Tax=Micromonospora pallida TaxID=145854 RepID=A0A1C6STR1_9ACTN|nr:PQQ-binding-like beta-propeller repeat protein [Micromonospora pallida]SCL33024.1 Outer membrane protein assembly factor BamB, contains PQQ-like beta-propeller repeat [Micromonospora pallida]
MALIDLGELRDEPGPDLTMRRRPGTGRRWRVGLVFVLVLTTLGPAVPAPRRASTTVPARSGSEAFLVGDQFLVVGPPTDGGRGDRDLTAYDLPGDGPPPSTLRRRWRVTVPGVSRFWPVTAVDRVLLIVSNRGGPAGHLTVALDTATGRERWRQAGSPMLTEGGAVLLTAPVEEGGQVARVVDPATGTARWSVPTKPGRTDFRFADQGVDRVVRTLPSGRVEVRDADSGRVLADEQVRPGGQAAGERGQVVGDLLVVLRDDPPTVDAYGLDRLIRHWTVSGPAVSYLSSCGVALCVWEQTGGLRVLDRATGRTAWSDRRWMGAFPVGDRLVATTSAGLTREQIFLLDLATGRVLADLGSWNGVQTPIGGRPPVASRQIRDRGLLVAEFDVEAGRPRILDVLPGDYADCRFHPDLLLCQRLDGSFQLSWLSD